MIHHRRSLRLKDYDYSQAGAYFVTICTYKKESIFGEIVNGEMISNRYGEIAENEWLKTAELRKNVELDEFIIMPNHFHCIIVITEGRGVLQYAPTEIFRSPSQTVGAIVRGFKSATTKHINQIRNTPRASLWQRNYYEHIIRNEKDLLDIQEYITNNPLKWDLDSENPENVKKQDRKVGAYCNTPLQKEF